MNVWNKVFYALIAVLCVGFTVLAANKYSLTKEWDAKLEAQNAKIAQLQDEIAALKIEIDGDPMKKAETWVDLGVRAQLDRVRGLLRGDAFVNCLPIEATTFEVDKDPISQESVLGAKISFAVPASYSLAAFADADDSTATFRKGAVAYVFDSGLTYVDEAAKTAEADAEATEAAAAEPRFLGAFKFVGAADAQAVLESVGNLTADELAAIQESQKSGRSWVVCVDRLPTDAPTNVAELIAADAETFASLDETTKTFFETANPSAQVFENLATVADATTAVDYQGLLARQFEVRDAQTLLKARRSLALNDLTYVLVDQLVLIGGEVDEATQALYSAEDFDAAVARKLVPSYEEQQTTLAAELEKMESYRDLAKSKLEEAQARVAECQAAIDATLAENARLATEIAQAQIALAKNAEQKSRDGGEPTTAFALSGI
ncbi:MAG: hypothetical protein IJE77_09100 [Thermoguttaceae bacterium]|nr:hypothetical protein [Thermoguttaceae bacterium]MBQ9799322.1 hypothetical protein [Thermoguttaceae bacterium]